METTEKLDFLATLLPLVGVLFVIAAGVVLLMQQFRKNLYRQRLEQEELIVIHQQELLRSSIQVQEEERKRIATDIHDELGATLSIARMHMMTLEAQSHPDTVQVLQNIRSLIETSMASVRRISHQLMPQNLQLFGLPDTLQNIVKMINSSNNIHVQIHCDEGTDQLPWATKLGLYRICLELMNNTIKHARAQEIILDISLEREQLELRYRDDGVGLPDVSSSAGLGQKSMEARALSIGGQIDIGNHPEGGFFATVTIPNIYNTNSIADIS